MAKPFACLPLLVLPLVLPGLDCSAQSSPEKTVKEILTTAAPAVVSIGTLGANGKPLGQASGFIVDPSGVIVTNFHVIQGAQAVQVKLQSGEVFDSLGVIDYDVRQDIALIKIRAVRLPTLKLADSQKVEQGDRAVAIGNPLGLEHTVSDGLISALRVFEGVKMFQTSVPISPGSSGGPLFNTVGEVIGITTAGFVAEGAQNLNLAVPSNYVEAMLAAMPAQPKFTFAELAQKHPAKRVEGVDRSAASTSPPGANEFFVEHQHRYGSCFGVLTLTDQSISYPPEGLEILLQDITELKQGKLWGVTWALIRVKTGKNYRFMAYDPNAYRAGQPANISDRLVVAIQQALPKNK